MNKNFKKYLESKNFAFNTIYSYCFATEQFKKKFKKFTEQNLKNYKNWLIENFRPKTVNLRIRAINCFLEFINMKELKISFIKIQQKTFLENVISQADYIFFKNSLKKENNYFWYFVIRFLAATGARISELIQIKIEHVTLGYLDIYSKGGKSRRIYIPALLQKETLKWTDLQKKQTGFLFCNKNGKLITTRGISGQLKKLAIKFGINPIVVYPHSFRHRFAKNFLEKHNDIAFLADLLGHESIETTRIYLRKTSLEQKNIIDNIIDW